MYVYMTHVGLVHAGCTCTKLMPRRGVIAAVTFKPRKASTGRLTSPLKTKSSR